MAVREPLGGGLLARDLLDFAVRCHGVDQSVLARSGRVERPGEQELEGADVPHQARQDVGRRELGTDAEIHERHVEARLLAAVDQVAVQQQRYADADGETHVILSGPQKR